MPTYTVTSANLALTTDQEAAIAAAITRSHHETTGAPAYFAQVIFNRIESGKHYIGGKAYRTPHLFVHGLIRAGRSADVKAALVKDIAAKVHAISGITAEDIWSIFRILPPPRWWSSAVFCPNRALKNPGARPCPRRSYRT